MLATGAAVAALTIPSLAAADCSVPANGTTGHPHTYTYDAPQNFSGSFTPDQQGSFVQIPFAVPSGTTGIRIRYCYSSAASGPTLDMGVYEPLHAGDTVPGVPERRGWSGSAVKDLAISQNGFSDAATYEAGRKDLVEGRTTRAYKPGSIPNGTWTAELGLASIPDTNPATNAATSWHVEVETSSDSRWSDDPYTPAARDAVNKVQNANAGWYSGDVHAHGEEEPGNALMKTSFDYAFDSPTGPDLDFLGLVDHNNDINKGEIGRYQADHPGHLIIPGTEVTTYHGHYNAIGSSNFADFRGGDVYGWNQAANGGVGALTAKEQDAVTPGSQFPTVDAGGGWSQINHPTIFPSDNPGFVSLCRGCPWDWSPTDTDYSKVDAIEVQTGPADIGTSPNPFESNAFAFYEDKLDAGFHIAAVGSSDSHKADQADTTSAPIGRATTMVYATQLSQNAIVQAIKDQHTYVKIYGNDGPNLDVTAHAPGAGDAIIGDDLQGPSASFDVNVKGALTTQALRPGAYSLNLLKDGTQIATVPITSDDFDHTFKATSTGRYSFSVTRFQSGNVLADPARTEDYSTPVWFSKGDNLKLSKAKVDPKHGTAKLAAKVTGQGKLKLSGSNIKGASTTASGSSTKSLPVKPTGKAAKDLKKKGKAKVTAKVTFTPTGGTAVTASQKVTLKKKIKKH